MINKKLLISYLEERIKEYDEQIVVLQSELAYCLMHDNKREFSIKNLKKQSIMSSITVYEDLLEKINNGDFKNQKIRNEVATINLTFAEEQLIKHYNSLNDNYNDVCAALEKEQKKNRKLKNHHKSSINFIAQINSSVLNKNSILTEGLNKLYQKIDENYTEALKNDDKSAIIRAKSELDLIQKIFKEV